MQPASCKMDNSVQVYFDAVPDTRQSQIKTLHTAIIECFPDATIDMRYKMPTYSHGDGWVAIANQKNYVSLYTCSAAHLTKFREKHPDYKMGKGCLNFREKDGIPVEDVKAVIRHAILHPKGS